MTNPDDDNGLVTKSKKSTGFEFICFSKLVDSIGGDNAKFSRKLMHDTNNGEMFFTEALTKWNDQDQGARYTAFVDEIPSDELQTYAQLLHHRELIATTLLRHMSTDVEKNGSIPAFCEVLTALARDLKDDFFDYMWTAFEALTNILEFCARDKDNVEAAFYCLTMLVKVLWRKLGKNIKKTFSKFVPLFASSRPFVRRFGSEAFAFLMRKLPNLREITQFIITQSHKTGDKHLQDGCAVLLFNVYRGISGGFHSAATEQLRDIIDGALSIEDEEVREYGAHVLLEMVTKTVEYVKANKKAELRIIEDVLLNCLESTGTMLRASHLARLIPLLFAERHYKSLFKSDKRLMTVLLKVIDAAFFELDSHLVALISESVTSIFIANTYNSNIRDLFNKLSFKQQSAVNDELLLDLLSSLHNIPCFDLCIMPSVGTVAERILDSQNSALVDKLIDLYALICAARRPAVNVVARPRSSFFDIERHMRVKSHLLDQLTKLPSLPIKQAIDAVVIWPWMFTQMGKVEGVELVLSWLKELMSVSETSSDASQAAYIVGASLFQVDKKRLTDIDAETFEAFITSQKCSESSIRLYNLYIVVTGQQTSIESLLRVVKLLEPAYYCVSSARRIQAMEVLSSFEVPLEGEGDKNDNGELLPAPENVFAVLLSAERAELTNFRDRLMHFRKLRHGVHQRNMPKGHGKELEYIILRMAISQLFVQFEPIWPGIMEVLTSFAQGMRAGDFWSQFSPIFEDVDNNCYVIDDQSDAAPSQFAHLVPGVDAFNRRNFLTARLELLKFLTGISGMAAAQTKLTSPLLLRLYKEQILKRMDENKPTITAGKKGKKTVVVDDDVEVVEEEEGEAADDEASGSENGDAEEAGSANNRRNQKDKDADGANSEVKLTRGQLYHALLGYLRLYAKFRNTRNIHLGKEITDMYLRLLTFNLPDIQKAVLECIFSFKDKHLMPYKEHLELMLDKTGFTNQLVLFTINLDAEEGCVLQPQDRKAVMPILLRVIYGRMNEKGLQKFIKSRKMAVFRYLAYCSPEELQLFLNIAFEPIVSVCGDDENMFDRMVEICKTESNLKTIHMSGVKDALLNVGGLVRICNTVMVAEQQSLLYRLLMCTAEVIRRVIETETGEDQGLMKQAREMRALLASTVGDYFNGFTCRDYSASELRQLCDVLLLPYAEEKHSSSDVTSDVLTILPTTVSRLMAVWTELPPLYHLFTLLVRVPCAGGPSAEPVSLFRLFLNPLLYDACSPDQMKCIRDGVWKMLSLADEPVHTNLDGLDMMPITRIPGINYGTSLVVAHLSQLLKFLAHALDVDHAQKKITEINLNIINRLSDFVEDGELGDRMTDTLVAYLERSVPKNSDVLQKMLTTIGRLVARVDEPEKYIRRIAPLYSIVHGETLVGRFALASLVKGMLANKNIKEELKPLLQYAIDLDSWDRSRMDEPDFDKRHAAYSQLNKIWAASEVIDDAILMVYAHIHTYTLTHATDLVLRVNSSLNLRTMFQYVARIEMDKEVKNSLLQNHFIRLALSGLKIKEEAVRDEFVRALTTLIDHFPSDSNLSEMRPLRRENTGASEEETDFFVNIIHIQMHRRLRALGRLVDELKEGKVTISYSVLSRFILPIAQHWMDCSESKHSAMSDASLKLFNFVMSLAAWPAYAAAVDKWLGQLRADTERERPIVRVVVAVVEAFHFEVADVDEQLEEDGSNAQRIAIRNHICKSMLPKLQTCINGKAAAMRTHKLAENAQTRYYYEDDDILRAPIALATVKLLKQTPESVMKQHLHGVILKLCSLMISRSDKVRETARKVMVKAVQCLTVRYLPFIIKEMKYILTKGFQVHVMIFTVNVLINAMRDDLVTGSLDVCLEEVLDVLIRDQFEGASEEKEIASIRGKTAEAKSNKSLETMYLLGKYVSGTSLGLVLEKLGVVLDTKTSSKTVTKIGDLLSKFATGVKENQGLTPHLQLVFVYQVLSEKVAKMEQLTESVKKSSDSGNGYRPESCLLIPKAPRRLGTIVKTSVKSRVHVFVEFALQLLGYLIRDKRFDMANSEDVARIDPFVAIINRCLTLKYDKVITYSLRCIHSLLLINLPSIRGQLKSITERLFVLLADYSALNTSGGQQAMLHILLFKAFTQIISLSESTFMTKKHLSLLLSHVEADVIDSQRNATAFSLVKAIIKKMIVHEQLPEVMKLLSEMSITSTVTSIRNQCRDAMCEYIGNHPSAGDPRDHLEFYCAQLEYEYETGRLSAAEALHHLFGSLLQKVLDENCMFCLVKLAARIVNDDSIKCRRFVSVTLRRLLQGVGVGQRGDVASAAFDWLQTEKEASRAVGLEVLVQLSFAEATRFSSRLPRLMEVIDDRLSSDEVMAENCESTLVSMMDGLVTILQNCGKKGEQALADSTHFRHIISSLSPLIKCLESLEVRRATTSFIGQLLTMWGTPFEPRDGMVSVDQLLDWMCWQLKDWKLTEALATQASKNVVCLSASLDDGPFAELCKRLAAVCQFEITRQDKESIKRTTCFKLAAALAVREFPGERYEAVLEHFLPLFVREMNRKSATNTEELYTLAMEIGEVLKNQMGEEEYGEKLAECQKKAILKTEDRKRKAKELAVTDPAEAAEQKRQKNARKIKSKKRKIDEMKPYRITKRAHLERERLMRDDDE